jgi:O-antigen ligase
LVDIPLLPLLLLAAFVTWTMGQRKNFEAPQFWLLPVLTLMLMLSLIFTGWFGGGLKALTDFAPVVMLFFLVATTVDSLQRLRQVFIVMSISATVIAIHGIDQSARGTGWTGAELSQGTRITYLGFLNDPNDLAMALIMVLPMAVYMARGPSWPVRLVSCVAAGLMTYAIYLTNSRGAILALAAMLGLYAVLRYGYLKSAVALPPVLLLLLALGPSRMNDMSADEDSAEGRIEAWYEGVQMLLGRPLFGVGKGQFAEHHGLTAHNSFVLAFAELGLIGYFFWLSVIVISWLMLQRLVLRDLPPPLPPDTAGPADGAPLHSPVDTVSPQEVPSSQFSLSRTGPVSLLPQEATAAAEGEGLAASESDSWTALQGAARTLWYGYLGGLAAAFFLSRSYVIVLYLHIGLIVAVFQLARREYPALPPVRFTPIAGRLVLLAIGSVIGMWLLTRVLLAFT